MTKLAILKYMTDSPLPQGEVPTPSVFERAKAILEFNDQGTHTIPAAGLYPHQWLWDSCFISIGIRHYDIDRAKQEIFSMLRGQWANGMMPNIILSSITRNTPDGNIWRSWLNPNAPDEVYTSGITQPPLMAEAVVRIGEKMNKSERRTWYKAVYPALVNYHKWLYAERDPHDEGLVLQVHPWETGLDSTPPWLHELHEHQLPLWITIIEKLHLTPIINLFRRDIKYVPANQRLNTIDALSLYNVQRRLRRKNYDIRKILSHSLFAIEDVTFNSIFIRANHQLREIAKFIQKDLPDDLERRMHRTVTAFEKLWDEYSQQYYSREFITHRLLKDSSIGAFMPLYAGTISKDRAKHIVNLLEDEHQFGTSFPVPSTPVNSEWFKPMCYWQGPTWINMNWLIIDGLKRYGYDEHAAALTESTLELIEKSGFAEYFSPLDGTPAGAPNFSWTAALAIDLLKQK